MYKYLFLILFSLSTLGYLACNDSDKKKLFLPPEYDQIQDILSIASCNSPFGRYTTEVNSYRDGSTYFYQKFDDRDRPFIVRIDSSSQGFLISPKDSIKDTLGLAEVEMIRGNEFHKLSSNPKFFFDDIRYEGQMIHNSQSHDLFNGIDKLKNEVNLLYNDEAQSISKIELLNPLDTSQIIEII
jgi:hypothetical protein